MTVSATFIEHCPSQNRNALNLLNMLCAVGAAFPPAIALILIESGAPYMWRFVVGVLSIFCICVSIARLRTFETPIYYFSCNKFDKAVEVLNQIALINGISDEYSLETPLKNLNEKVSILSDKNEAISVGRQIKRLIEPQFRRVFLLQIMVICSQIWFLTSFTASGIGMFMPTFISRAGGSTDNSDLSVYSSMFFINLGGIPATLFTSWLMSTKLKRKWSLVVVFAATAIFLSALVWGGFSFYFVRLK